jgi:hypothetical protein
MSCFFVAANGTSAVVPSVAADGTPAGELCDECRWWSGSLLAFLFRRQAHDHTKNNGGQQGGSAEERRIPGRC